MRRRLLTILAVPVLAAGAYIGWLCMSQDPVARLPRWVQLRPSIYLNTALSRLETSGFAAGDVNWAPVQAHAKSMTSLATTPDETYGAIRYALDHLPDGLSRLLTPEEESARRRSYGLEVLFPDRVVAVVYPGSAAEAAGIHPGDLVELVEGHPPMVDRAAPESHVLIDMPPPETSLRVRPPGGEAREVPLTVAPWSSLSAGAHRLGDDIGFVELPGSSASGSVASAVQAAIASSDGPMVCGWLIDLRRSMDSDLETMLQAVHAIVGEPPFGSSVDGHGTLTPWAYPASAQPVTPLQHPHSPVALLTSRLTAGGAEGVVVAFRARPGSRTFGEPTRGRPTTSRTYSLANGAALVLTVGFDVDRAGTVYRTRIPPDEAMPVNWARLGTPTDPMIEAASAWLRSQPACKH